MVHRGTALLRHLLVRLRRFARKIRSIAVSLLGYRRTQPPRGRRDLQRERVAHISKRETLALANARTPSISRERPTFADRPGNAPGAPTLLPALRPAWERCAGRRTPAETRSRPLSVAALASLPSDRSSRVRIAGHLHRAVAATLPARSESRCVGFPSLDRCAVW